MEKNSIINEDLAAAITSAVNAAIDAREKNKKRTFVSRKATAQRLHVDPSTLWRWDKSGFLQPVRIAGRLWYDEGDIERLENGEIEA